MLTSSNYMVRSMRFYSKLARNGYISSNVKRVVETKQVLTNGKKVEIRKRKQCPIKLQSQNVDVFLVEPGIVVVCKLENKGRFAKKLVGSLVLQIVDIKTS
ncbi:unnamed protein product [Cochlearia groenlandica]